VTCEMAPLVIVRVIQVGCPSLPVSLRHLRVLRVLVRLSLSVPVPLAVRLTLQTLPALVAATTAALFMWKARRQEVSFVPRASPEAAKFTCLCTGTFFGLAGGAGSADLLSSTHSRLPLFLPQLETQCVKGTTSWSHHQSVAPISAW
jgi:hypothetical protein